MKTPIKTKSWKAVFLAAGWLVAGCGSTNLVQTPVEKVDEVPLKIADLTKSEAKAWGHADLRKDTIPGMSVDRAYREILGNSKGKTVVVAVLDSGMDLDHEDLDGVLWTNKDERPGNGKDDDNTNSWKPRASCVLNSGMPPFRRERGKPLRRSLPRRLPTSSDMSRSFKQ